MIAVIFEVMPHAETRQTYLDIAAALRPRLDEIDGFISIERFQSLTDPGKLLSLSFWRDEESVSQWRKTEEHRGAQAAGRARAGDPGGRPGRAAGPRPQPGGRLAPTR